MKKFTYRNTATITGNIIEEYKDYYIIEANDDIYTWEKELTMIENIEKENFEIVEFDGNCILDASKYYIVEERQTAHGVEIKSILSITRSTKKLGYKYIEKNNLPTLENFHDFENGVKYAGQWYFNCRKGSTI